MSNRAPVFPDFWEYNPPAWGTSLWSDYASSKSWSQRLEIIINDYWIYLQKRENSFIYCPFIIGDDTPKHTRTFIQKESKKASPLLNEKKFKNPYKIKKIWPKINLVDYVLI